MRLPELHTVRRKLTISAVSLLATLLAGELGLRAYDALAGKAPPQLDEGIELEWQWALDHLAGKAQPDPISAFHPVLGYVNAPSLRRADIRTNSAGMRAEREYDVARTPGVPRMLLVGDSYTFGWTVSNEHAWGEVLNREYLPGWEVLNFGVPGYGTDQALLAYETLGVPYQPDVVVLGFFVRDFTRNLRHFHAYLKPKFELAADGSLRLDPGTLVPPEELLELYRTGQRRIGGWNYSHLLAKIASGMQRARQCRGLDSSSRSVRLLGAILERFRDEVRARGGKPFFLVFPERLDKHLGTYWEEIEQLALAQAGRLGLPALSLTRAFVEEERRAPSVPLNPHHLSIEGNEVAARALHEALVECGYVPAGARPPPR
jgi:lysophospholipase L1-like esterase